MYELVRELDKSRRNTLVSSKSNGESCLCIYTHLSISSRNADRHKAMIINREVKSSSLAYVFLRLLRMRARNIFLKTATRMRDRDRALLRNATKSDRLGRVMETREKRREKKAGRH